LGNLTVVYDQKCISIEEDADISFSEDVAKRYKTYGWDVQVVDWRCPDHYTEVVVALLGALECVRRNDTLRLVILRTIIAWPAPNKRDTGASHGSALGEEEVAATKELLGFVPAVMFPEEPEVLEHARKVIERGGQAHA